MMNRINNFLIGLLWLLAMTLGATFWFNIMYGFNIFSAPHWQHLAYMQAIGQPVRLSFYISIVIAVIMTTFGLYVLLQSRFRRITTPVFDRVAQPEQNAVQTNTNVLRAQTEPTEQPQITPAATSETDAPTNTPNIVRPPRLNIPTVTRSEPAPRVPTVPLQKSRINPETEYAAIREIFESAGYVFKGMPKIKGVQTATVAIGTAEVLWIGAVGVKTADMQRAVQTLSGIFSDTLEDIEIHINAFIVAPADSTDNTDILGFATVDDLRKYIHERPNTPPDADDIENFDAYSGYIGTVVDYIGKI